MTYLYEEVLDRIEHARRFGNLPGVKVSRAMLHRLGEPQKGMPYVHVAGTNGKGSVCAFLSSILKEAGYKVGVFTSPHLVDINERFVIEYDRSASVLDFYLIACFGENTINMSVGFLKL